MHKYNPSCKYAMYHCVLRLRSPYLKNRLVLSYDPYHKGGHMKGLYFDN